MSYAEIAELVGISHYRVGQLVREAWRLVQAGYLQITNGKVRLQNGEDVIKDDL